MAPPAVYEFIIITNYVLIVFYSSDDEDSVTVSDGAS